MLNWEQIIISALVGAAIGYITNWIAIKMLFRPLTAKRVMGIRLPFTPGVIPKEKKRLAMSIGDAVSEHLLTQEYISGQLLSPAAEEKVRLFIREKINGAGDKTVAEVMDGLGIDSRIRENGLKHINDVLLKGARDDRLQSFLAGQLAEITLHVLDRYPAELVETEEFSVAKRFLKNVINGFLNENREQMKQFLAARLDRISESTLTLRECIPEPLLDTIRKYAEEQGARIVVVVNNYLNSPETKKLLVKRVEQFFDRSVVRRLMGNILGRLGGSPGQVADKIVQEVAGFFAEPGNRKLLARKIEDLLDDMLDCRICDLAARLDAENRKNMVLELGDWLSDRLCSGEILEGLLTRAEKALASSGMTWGQVLGLNDKARQKAGEYYKQFIEKTTSGSEFEISLKNFTTGVAAWMLSTKAAIVLSGLFGEKDRAEEKLLGYYRCFVKRHMEDIVGFVNFRQLVARRVDGLDILQVEELVLGIMRRELVAITWFGAILGAGIGISMVIMQSFFK